MNYQQEPSFIPLPPASPSESQHESSNRGSDFDSNPGPGSNRGSDSGPNSASNHGSDFEHNQGPKLGLNPLVFAFVIGFLHIGSQFLFSFFFSVVFTLAGSFIDGPVIDFFINRSAAISIVVSSIFVVLLVIRTCGGFSTIIPLLNRRHTPKDYFFTVAFGLIVYLFGAYTSGLVSLLPFIPESNHIHILLGLFPDSLIIRLLLMALMPSIVEELLYRGIILERMLRQWGPKQAILWSSLIFGLIHLDPVQSSYAAIIGLLIGWLYYKSRSLLLAIVVHFIVNSYGVLLMHLGADQWGESTILIYGLSFLVVSLGLGIPSIIYFKRKTIPN